MSFPGVSCELVYPGQPSVQCFSLSLCVLLYKPSLPMYAVLLLIVVRRRRHSGLLFSSFHSPSLFTPPPSPPSSSLPSSLFYLFPPNTTRSLRSSPSVSPSFLLAESVSRRQANRNPISPSAGRLCREGEAIPDCLGHRDFP